MFTARRLLVPTDSIANNQPLEKLLTVEQAAEVLGVSVRHIRTLIYEADTDKQSRWKHGREIINLSPKTALRRTLRINPHKIIPVS